MSRFVGKLLVLLAVLLMPFEMAPAAAAAAHHGAATAAMQHCPGQPAKHHGKTGFVECTMACSAALPAAANSPGGEPLLIICAPIQSTVAQVLRGLHPETATPPPKGS